MPSKNEQAATMTASEARSRGILSAQDAENRLKSNSKKLYGFTRKILPQGLPTEPRIFIYSVSEYGERVNLGPGLPAFEVEACPEGEKHGEACPVPPIVFFEEAKVDVTEMTPITDIEIVNAVLRIGPGMDANNDRRKVGWFTSEHNPPKKEEVERAKEIYVAHCKVLFEQAQRYATDPKTFSEINQEHRRAAKVLGQKVNWNTPQVKNIDCPGCGESVREGVIWHATPHGCGYIFNREEFDKRFAKAS